MITTKQQGKKITSIRDDRWLLSRLDHIWTNFFHDIKQENPVFIKFGRYSRYRLGSIKFDQKTSRSFITITSVFKNEKVPVDVIDHTIAHELCHYAHGFSSPKTKLHKYPHHGGVIRKELQARCLDYLVKAYALWLKQYRKTLKAAM